MKLTQKILFSLAMYYLHRHQSKCSDLNFKWNKKADLDEIDKCCVASNIEFETVAGTFWFHKNKKCKKLNEASFPEFMKEQP